MPPVPSFDKLPEDVIREVYKYLTTKERFRAGVCCRLREIEKEMNYDLKGLILIDDANCNNVYCAGDKDVKMYLSKCFDKSYMDGIDKLTARKGSIFNTIILNIADEKYSDLITKVSTLKANRVCIDFENEKLSPILTENLIEKLTKKRVMIEFNCPTPRLTSALLRRLFDRIVSEGTMLNEVGFSFAPARIVKEFLYSIGFYVNSAGDFFSTFEGVKVFSDDRGTYFIRFDDLLVKLDHSLFIANKEGGVVIRRYDSDFEIDKIKDEDEREEWGIFLDTTGSWEDIEVYVDEKLPSDSEDEEDKDEEMDDENDDEDMEVDENEE